MARSVYQVSPIGVFQHPWFNKPDTKFAQQGSAGVYKCHHEVSGANAKQLAEKIAEASDAALAAYIEEKGLKAAEAKKWSVYYPFEKLVDDDGETETGVIAFAYKQNAEITLRDGTKKAIVMTVVDAGDKAMSRPVFSGSEGRLMFTMRPITMVSTKQVGVRLDFAKVQVTKLAESNGPSFGAVEGYREEDDETSAGGRAEKATSSGADQDSGGDY